VRGLDTGDMCALMECGLGRKGIYYFDHVNKEAIIPPPRTVAWPVEFLLARHNRKHIFIPRQLPTLHEIGVSINDWANRVRWACYFDSIGEQCEANEWRWVAEKKQRVSRCPEELLEQKLGEKKHSDM